MDASKGISTLTPTYATALQDDLRAGARTPIHSHADIVTLADRAVRAAETSHPR
jgi:hypothetical protein